MKYSKYTHKQIGFSLIEIMIALVILSLVVAGMGQFFITLKKNTRQQDNQLELNERLRVAMTRITDDARNAGFITPKDANLKWWITWTGLPTLINNPIIVDGASGASDSLYIIAATDKPVTTVKNKANPGDSSVKVYDTSQINLAGRSLININNREFARVVSKTSDSLRLDTVPVKSGVSDLKEINGSANNDPILNTHLVGAPVFVVVVKRYSHNATTNTLQVLNYGSNGNTVQDVMQGITDLQIQAVGGNNKRLRISLTGTTDKIDQDTGAKLTRTMVSEVASLN